MKYKVGDLIIYKETNAPIYLVIGIVERWVGTAYKLKNLSGSSLEVWDCNIRSIDDEENYRAFDFMSEILGGSYGENI